MSSLVVFEGNLQVAVYAVWGWALVWKMKEFSQELLPPCGVN